MSWPARRAVSAVSTSFQSPTTPTSDHWKIIASGSVLIPTIVPALRTPTVWLNLPDAPIEMNSLGAIECPINTAYNRLVWYCEAEQRSREELYYDAEFRAQWRRIARENKSRLAKLIELYGNVTVDPNTLFDVQAKRFHEYKRQHLNVLHIITLFKRLRRDPNLDLVPRTFLFAGKAAPGYRMAKLMIKLIHSVAAVVNEDRAVGGRIKVAFLPDYNVKHSQHVYPAADLSEQISTAGKEASGTGNMKFAMNGALTIGTLDGANIEIRSAVGPENFFLFGLTADQVRDLKSSGYRPRDYYESNPELRECLDMISSDVFSRSEPGLFAPMVDELLGYDPYMLLADYQSYVDCQERVSRAFLDTETWTRMSILNCARTGRFSSDRSIREYCEKVWNVRI